MKKNILKIIIVALIVSCMGIFVLSGCSKPVSPNATPTPTLTERPSPTPQAEGIPAVDRHIKKSDIDFDFLQGMPQGVTVDSSSVDFESIGAYDIVYKKQGAEDITKKAYIYGMPQLFYGTDLLVQSEIPLTYREASAVDFFKASDLSVSAKDSFGKALEITVTAEPFSYEYGEYPITYSAKDAAGNETAFSVIYMVSGENQQDLNNITVDLSQSSTDVEISWANVEDYGIYIDGINIPTSYYTTLTGANSGVRLSTYAFNINELTQKNSYTVRVKTDIWYDDINVSITDNEEPRFTANGNNYIFSETDCAAIPLSHKLTAQRFNLSYEVTGGSEGDYTATEKNKEIQITRNGGGNLAVGRYTLSVKAYRDSQFQNSKDVYFNVYTQSDFGKIIATMSSEQYRDKFDDLFATQNNEYKTFTYDADMGAYRYNVPITAPSCSWTSLFIGMSGEIYSKYDAGRYIAEDNPDGYKYVAIDLCFAPNSFINDILFAIKNTKNNVGSNDFQDLKGDLCPPVRIYKSDDINKTALSFSELTTGNWYTVVLEAEENSYGGKSLCFAPFNSTKKEEYASVSDVYIRNFRFCEQLSEVMKDNYITVQNNYVSLPHAADGSTISYTVTAPDATSFEINSGKGFTVSQTGEYTAVYSSGTLAFCVYSESDFNKLIVSLSSEQQKGMYEALFASQNNEYKTFTYDADMEAYRYNVPTTAPSCSWTSLFIGMSGEIYSKYNAGRYIAEDNPDGYKYVAIDLCFAPNSFINDILFAIKNTKNNVESNDFQDLKGDLCPPVRIYKSDDINKTALSFSELETGKWYTVVLEAGENSYGGKSLCFAPFNSTNKAEYASVSDVYMRNFRFCEQLSEVMKDNYITVQNNYVSLPHAADGSTISYTVTAPDATSFEINSGKGFTVSQTGEYTAVYSSGTLAFCVYSESDFNKLIVSLSSEQYKGMYEALFASQNNDYKTFTYDADMEAYRYNVPTTAPSCSWTSLFIGMSGEIYSKYNAGRYIAEENPNGYRHVAIDLCFAPNSFINDMIFAIKNTNPNAEASDYQDLKGDLCPPVSIYLANDPNKTAVEFSELETGKWYTVVLEAGENSYGGKSLCIAPFNSTNKAEYDSVSDVYIRNFRFTEIS